MKKMVHQTGIRKSLHADRLRHAKAVGMRTSASGSKYFESRRNRSDLPHKRI